VQKPATVAPAADDPTASEHLAREALAEALEAITSMRTVIAAIERGPAYMCNVNQHLKDDLEMPDPKDELVVDAVEDVPAVLLFNLLAKRVNTALSFASRGRPAHDLKLKSPATVWGLTEEDYERQVLSAFSVAEERTRRVALAYKSELERIAKELAAVKDTGDEWSAARGWVKAFGLAVQARSGVALALPVV
jgi:hypothetical protein